MRISSLPPAKARAVIQRLGKDLFPDLNADKFLEVLIWAALRGVPKDDFGLSIGSIPDDFQPPSEFDRLHQGNLKYWAVFEISTDNGVLDDAFYGAVYHSALRCGVVVVLNGAGAVSFSQPFEFAPGRLPKHGIARTLLGHIRSEGCPMYGQFINFAPDFCPRARIKTLFNKLNQEFEPEDPDGQFDDYYRESR